MGRRRAQMVFTDPPYNVSIKGVLAANGRVKHPEFVMASGEMSSEEFAEFLACALGHHAAYSQQGAIHFICMDWRHLGELLRAGRGCLFRAQEPLRLEEDQCGHGQLLSLAA